MKIPSAVKLHKKSAVLELHYEDGSDFQLRCELLRVYSPSAEVRGHGSGQEVLQTGKKNVTITAIQAVGNYALQLTFDDGHDTGLFSWDYLYDLGLNQEKFWQEYVGRLHAAGASRDPEVQVLRVDL
ncbi:DUF971 domain-containing protein [Halieaceae bacterium IMCC14734]|uniref:DUF971 domain-containing protein n=1 Tax=Candidatus Litorirhabdus singularis TaxID=2518993 RepID=A0ABT3TED5_9GAMM|nr:DUF971 domain-containing protein [Candidatus Litorirhabdus singularis]MCX2979787.1 DUF971 domain-containing protein [Candidatus Litorirhabdus singularis]